MKDGGPAFPMELTAVGYCDPGHPIPLQIDEKRQMVRGMTLLDYFAGQALAGILSNGSYVKAMILTNRDNFDGLAACRAYDLAAAMLAERERIAKEGAA